MNMNANFAQGEINQGINPSIIISSPNVVCECGNKVFIEAVILKKVSLAVQLSTPSLTFFKMPCLFCVSAFFYLQYAKKYLCCFKKSFARCIFLKRVLCLLCFYN